MKIAILIGIVVLLLAFEAFTRGRGSKLKASWYGHECSGRLMANGQPFRPLARTCASYSYPLGTWLAVSYGKVSTLVEVTDRGPGKKARARGVDLDLSLGAWTALGLDQKKGVADVTVEICDLDNSVSKKHSFPVMATP